MWRALFFLALFPTFLFARKGSVAPPETGEVAPWFTGPLLAPAMNVVGEGAYNIEPYLFATKSPAIYDNDWDTQELPALWNLTLQVPVWVGLTDWCDISFSPSLMWNHKEIGGGAWAQGDFVANVHFQLWHQDWSDAPWPSIKIGLSETVPLGKYRNLNPKKLGADLGGNGSWVTGFELVVGQVLHITGYQFLSWRIGGRCALFNSLVHVKGFDAYGGGFGANGRIRPGFNGGVDLGLEYSVSRHWAFALDITGYWQAKAKFNGFAGVSVLPGTHTVVGRSSAILYTLAPAVEYNWNENLGIITGVWFTVAGKQISKFYSYIFAVNWYK